MQASEILLNKETIDMNDKSEIILHYENLNFKNEKLIENDYDKSFLIGNFQNDYHFKLLGKKLNKNVFSNDFESDIISLNENKKSDDFLRKKIKRCVRENKTKKDKSINNVVKKKFKNFLKKLKNKYFKDNKLQKLTHKKLKNKDINFIVGKSQEKQIQLKISTKNCSKIQNDSTNNSNSNISRKEVMFNFTNIKNNGINFKEIISDNNKIDFSYSTDYSKNSNDANELIKKDKDTNKFTNLTSDFRINNLINTNNQEKPIECNNNVELNDNIKINDLNSTSNNSSFLFFQEFSQFMSDNKKSKNMIDNFKIQDLINNYNKYLNDKDFLNKEYRELSASTISFNLEYLKISSISHNIYSCINDIFNKTDGYPKESNYQNACLDFFKEKSIYIRKFVQNLYDKIAESCNINRKNLDEINLQNYTQILTKLLSENKLYIVFASANNKYVEEFLNIQIEIIKCLTLLMKIQYKNEK